MDGAAHQRTPRECLAQSLMESQENRLGARFSPGAKTQAAFTQSCTGVTQFLLLWPIVDLPGPEQIHARGSARGRETRDNETEAFVGGPNISTTFRMTLFL